jgi:hypothetical protein
MAKMSLMQREEKREKLVAKFAKKYAQLQEIARNAKLSDEEQKVFKKAMGKLGTVEGDFVLDVEPNFLEQALSPQMEVTAEKAKEPDLGAASIASASDRTAAALSELRSARSVQLDQTASIKITKLLLLLTGS